VQKLLQVAELVGHDPPSHMFIRTLANPQSSEESHTILSDAPVLKPEPKPPYSQVPLHSSSEADTQSKPEHEYESQKIPHQPRVTVTVQRVEVTKVPVPSR